MRLAELAATISSLSDVSVSTSKVQLSSSSARAISQGILVTAHPSNTAVVRISGTDVTSTKGQPLGPGASWNFPVKDATGLFAVAESGSQTVCVSLV